MKITWRVSDGYISNGSHVTEIDDTELEGLSDEEREEAIEYHVMEDFGQIVSWEEIRRDP